MAECAAHGCHTYMGHNPQPGALCVRCQRLIVDEQRKLDSELAAYLQHHAAFDRWCTEHGRTDPHDT